MSSDPFKNDPYANGRLDEIHQMLIGITRGNDALRTTNQELSAENAVLRKANTTLRRRLTALLPDAVKTKPRPLSKCERALLKGTQ